jgi:UTP:GlnB (protein PII) uridylyltransferase
MTDQPLALASMPAISLELTPTTEALDALVQSMPEGYRATYDELARREHAAIVARRGSQTVHLERWRSLPDGGALVLIVADDRPGLLSLICASLVRHRLEVRVAQIYTRERPGDLPEAVDFFWLRATDSRGSLRPVEAHDLEKFSDTLAEMIEAPPRTPRTEPSLAAAFAPIAARAFFNTKAMRRGEHLLVVEARDFPGLLLTITRTLHAHGVVIVSSTVHTEGNIARDSFVLKEPGGGIFSPERLTAIRQAVVSAVRGGPPTL